VLVGFFTIGFKKLYEIGTTRAVIPASDEVRRSK